MLLNGHRIYSHSLLFIWTKIAFLIDSFMIHTYNLHMICVHYFFSGMLLYVVFIFMMVQWFLFPHTGKHTQSGIFATFPSGEINQITPPRLHDSNIALDICSVIQSTSLCLFIDRDAFFHLFHYRNAGKKIIRFSYKKVIDL